MSGNIRRRFTDDELKTIAEYFEALRDHNPVPRSESKRVVRLVAELRDARDEVKRLYEEKARLLQRVMDAQAALREKH